MENKINIAEILRDMPKGTKLYSPLFGECECIEVANSKYPIVIKAQSVNGAGVEDFTENGRFIDGFEGATCLLFPSAKMRNWSKFFKRGDVVYNPDGEMFAIFEGWVSDDCTEFNTKLNLCKINNIWSKKGKVCFTECFSKATDEEKAKFIAAAEKHYDGKYNHETLQVEPVKVIGPKCPFKPFQKVLVRNDRENTWCANYFSHYLNNTDYHYACIDTAYRYCVAYEGNEYLLGTNNRPE